MTIKQHPRKPFVDKRGGGGSSSLTPEQKSDATLATVSDFFLRKPNGDPSESRMDFNDFNMGPGNWGQELISPNVVLSDNPWPQSFYLTPIRCLGDLTRTVIVRNTDPLVDHYLPGGSIYRGQIRVPVDFWMPPENSNGSVILFNIDEGTAVTLNVCTRPTPGGTIFGYDQNGAHAGSGLPNGTITYDELMYGTIEHPVALMLSHWANSTSLYAGMVDPASRVDGKAYDHTFVLGNLSFNDNGAFYPGTLSGVAGSNTITATGVDLTTLGFRTDTGWDYPYRGIVQVGRWSYRITAITATTFTVGNPIIADFSNHKYYMGYNFPEYYGRNGVSEHLRNGSRLTFPPGVTAESLGITDKYTLKIFNAIKKYGAIVVDDTKQPAWFAISVDKKAFTSIFPGDWNAPIAPREPQLISMIRSTRVVLNNPIEVNTPKDIPGLIAHIDASAVTLTSGKVSAATDLSGRGNNAILPAPLTAATNGLTVANVPISYPDPLANTVKTLPNKTMAVFNRVDDTNRTLRIPNILTGLTEWTIFTAVKATADYGASDRFVWAADNPGGGEPMWLAPSSHEQMAGPICAGNVYNQRSNSPMSFVGRDSWVIIVHSYKPPRTDQHGKRSSRNLMMVNGIMHVLHASGGVNRLEADGFYPGTVSATAGSTTITGVGTSFLSQYTPGGADFTDRITLNDDMRYIVQSVESDTSLTVTTSIFQTVTNGTHYRGLRLNDNRDFATVANDYPMRTDLTHLHIGNMNPRTLTPYFAGNGDMQQKCLGVYNRALAPNEMTALTESLWRDLYPDETGFKLNLHTLVGGDLLNRNGFLENEAGFAWRSMSQVRRSATMMVNLAENGNTIEYQTTKARATLGKSLKPQFIGKAICTVHSGFAQLTDANRIAKLENLVRMITRTGLFTQVYMGNMIAVGTGNPPTTLNATANTASVTFNTALATAIATGGSIAALAPDTAFSLLDFANVIPSGFTAAIKVFDPAGTLANTLNSQISLTTPADTTNAATYHYSGGVVPRLPTLAQVQNPTDGNGGVLGAQGFYELQRANMLATLGYQ
jgi:hypothetical protein